MHRRLLVAVPAALAVAFLLLVLAGLLALLGSLPRLDGARPLPGLGQAARIERDALGTVTVTAASQADMARALGYVHAQERYFAMDLSRRSAAGELAALFGPLALKRDLAMRPHRLRARAEAGLATLPAGQRQLLAAYADGANAGLADLRVRPWAYLLLRQRPQPWSETDSLLVVLAMYADLQGANLHNAPLWQALHAHAPAALTTLLGHGGSRHDAPLLGPALGDAPLPDAAALDLRQYPHGSTGAAGEAAMPGSNNFAVAGALTADGRAIVADDMHLGLGAPNIWFRARLRYPHPGAADGQIDVAGFTLPGLPAVVVGSNGHVAWGFTNSYIDNVDLARYDATALATPGVVSEYGERIVIAGGDDHILSVRETGFGPLLHPLPDGSALAVRWTAHLPGAVNLGLAALAHAADIDQALAMADDTALPAQNLVIGDRSGRIAWRLIGARPARAPGCPPGLTRAMASAAASRCPPWALRTDAAPTLRDPAHGRLWTANNRVLDPATLASIGDGGYDLGARAAQIRDGLFARQRFSEADLLAIQRDDRALLLTRWHALLRQTVANSDDPALQRLEEATRQWPGRADPASASYRLVRSFRSILLARVQAGLLAPVQQALGPDWPGPRLPQLEGIIWPLLEQRPDHLLPPGVASWDALLADSARTVVAGMDAEGDDELSRRTWGERNTARICHPLQRALPALARRWLCMPADRLAGDSHMPLVAAPDFGASQRMVVAPGHEVDGIVHMPGGQSGHPLSPFWGAGHADWVQGRPTPFLPGPTAYTLQLDRPH